MYLTPWTHPKTHVTRYYVNGLTSAPSTAKVYLDSHNDIHIYNCTVEEQKAIIEELTPFLSHSSVTPTTSNHSLIKYTIYPYTGNIMSYTTLESATKRILALRKKGEHVYRIKREADDVYSTYKVFLSANTYFDGFYTSGYQHAYKFTDEEYAMEGGRFED